MTITFQGSPLTLEGNRVKVGDKAPNFKAIDTDLNEFNFNETKGKRIILSVPSIDTPVCDIELNRFNREVSNLKDVNKGKRIILSVPSIDTPVCDIELNRFNREVSNLKDVNLYAISLDLPFAQSRWCGLYAISLDLPFAQSRWCGAKDIKNVKIVSDYKFHDFAKAYGLYIKELGLLSRAVFIIDENDNIVYADYVQEVTNEPNYEEILNLVK